MKKLYLNSIAVVLGIFASYISFKFCTSPFIWIFLSWSLVSFFTALGSLHSKSKLVLCYISASLFSLGLFEAYLEINNEAVDKSEVILTSGYYQNNDILGYGPTFNFQANANKLHGEKIIYDVKYTIESNGLRKSPPFNGSKNTPCIIFFGGSVTFGEGVNDDETMPYRVGIKTGGKYRIYNFGFHGYGPHQMLSAIEHGLVKKTIQCKPRFVIYQAILAHTARSAGLASWDKHGPQYEIGKTGGEVSFVGNFDDNNLIPISLTRKLEKSQIYLKIFGSQRAINQSDIGLFLGIVTKTKNLLKTRYPEAIFQVLYWDSKAWSQNQDEANRKLINGFKNSQIPVHLLSSILPGFHDNQSIYELSPHDHHPKAQTHDLISEYLVEKIFLGDR